MVDGMRQHHRQLAQRPPAFGMPLVERLLHQCQVTQAGRRLVDDLLGDQRGGHVVSGDEGGPGYPMRTLLSLKLSTLLHFRTRKLPVTMILRPSLFSPS